ncbi:hypothetical protein M5K25_010026 [Dendrobium thyrsiflorum]|uniref:Uncharacterized protein n=1 Tax=Dendrobium thyrsiflorum TaxID=117978 RepID=A0ABD0UZR0_DENTH
MVKGKQVARDLKEKEVYFNFPNFFIIFGYCQNFLRNRYLSVQVGFWEPSAYPFISLNRELKSAFGKKIKRKRGERKRKSGFWATLDRFCSSAQLGNLFVSRIWKGERDC